MKEQRFTVDLLSAMVTLFTLALSFPFLYLFFTEVLLVCAIDRLNKPGEAVNSLEPASCLVVRLFSVYIIILLIDQSFMLL